jgi:hypothetical protein
MDAKNFDRWTASVTRLLTEPGSRRRTVALGLAGVSGLWHLGNADESIAKRKHRKHKKRKKNNQSPPPPATDACTNGVKDGSETDVDCGGGTCKRCALGQACTGRIDCFTARCVGGTCQACEDPIADCTDQCACRQTVGGPKVCTQKTCTLHLNGTCDLCAPGEQCATAGGNDIECCQPCTAP